MCVAIVLGNGSRSIHPDDDEICEHSTTVQQEA